MKWRPIETAPELENVLVVRAGCANSMTTAWIGHGSKKYPAEWRSVVDRNPLNAWDQPTHWMPLPEPPETP